LRSQRQGGRDKGEAERQEHCVVVAVGEQADAAVGVVTRYV
jgi:hypothetical protein